MKRTIVTYKVKPERVAEHEALIRAVFTELAALAPANFRYEADRRADGVSFVHVAVAEGDNPLPTLAAFKAFTAQIKDRCDEPPLSTETQSIGAYPT